MLKLRIYNEDLNRKSKRKVYILFWFDGIMDRELKIGVFSLSIYKV